jgi:hypothetical protein
MKLRITARQSCNQCREKAEVRTQNLESRKNRRRSCLHFAGVNFGKEGVRRFAAGNLGWLGAAALAVAAFLFVAPGTGSTQAKKEQAGKSPVATAFAEDKGRFRVLVDGQPSGTEEFQIARAGSDWVARGSVDITAGGGTTKLSSILRVRGDGTPVKYEFDMTGTDGKKSAVDVVFNNGTATIETQAAGSPAFTQEFFYEKPRVVVLDNNLYHHYALLVRMFDWKARGAQTFAVLIPQDQLPGSVTVEYIGEQNIGGARLEALRMKSADLEAFLYVDNNRRLMRIAVPDSKAEVVRE